MSKRELLRRLEAVEAALAQRTERPLEGQQSIPVAAIGHRDEHQLVEDDDLEETR